ncbi:RdgB/HAM1 family non-canonical purine NTP pyrophosphatase [Steroidobacter agaridevorans]|uniref:RdgB/HAM1 family non-canonical purine NTP pyrophosphatase n=1 Tax=Steroidobacter agaridevorans TaxID=2695856 RepID=UPI00132BD745|nr:RdgB/HAM1 family non-canonical purine NTP pyrophosphatase [Steroidobacter agaridevorans]GFE89782.1 non-canonical purine NTP pyrophosphatase [Steroidobacter agaridevorans]
MRLVIATGNAGKLKELRELLPPPAFEVLPQSQFTSVSVEETGLTFVENAILKARHAAEASGLPAIADDSGLEVDALEGAPGIYSARYAGEGASDEDNLRKLLAALEGKSPAERTARYQCALVYLRAPRDPSPLICQASWEGRITSNRRGTGGFGYDPIFELADRPLTVAELPAAEKNQLSHRGQALRGLITQVRGIYPIAS